MASSTCTYRGELTRKTLGLSHEIKITQYKKIKENHKDILKKKLMLNDEIKKKIKKKDVDTY